MKKRFRTLVRGGWHIIEVPPGGDEIMSNEDHYRMLRQWCASNVEKNDWEGTLNRTSNTKGMPLGQKRFAFKNVEDKLVFALRWS